jgi:glycosyltransferase involved in cell wall biosynthesis
VEQQKLNILFISAWYPNKINPTLGNFVEKHVQAANIYCNAYVLHVVFDNTLINKRFLTEYSIENSIPVLRIYISNKKVGFSFINSLARFFFYHRAYRKGYKYLIGKHGKPDVIHANILFPTGMIALLLNRNYKVPYVFTEHWTGYMSNDPNPITYINKTISIMAAQKAAAIMPVSTDLMEAMIKHEIIGKYHVVPNVIDTNLFYYKPKENKSEKFRFVHISSLDNNQKNVIGILNAVHQLSLNRTDFELKIISDGNIGSYKKIAEELTIQNNIVKFESSKTTEEIAQILQTSDCLIMFSNYESFSVVIAEALACGIPVIATRAGGLANELTTKQGIIINIGNEIALCNSMNEMINKYDSYNKAEIATFGEKFSYENVGKTLHKIYLEASKLQNNDRYNFEIQK